MSWGDIRNLLPSAGRGADQRKGPAWGLSLGTGWGVYTGFPNRKNPWLTGRFTIKCALPELPSKVMFVCVIHGLPRTSPLKKCKWPLLVSQQQGCHSTCWPIIMALSHELQQKAVEPCVENICLHWVGQIKAVGQWTGFFFQGFVGGGGLFLYERYFCVTKYQTLSEHLIIRNILGI